MIRPKTYTELTRFAQFEHRYAYLKLGGSVGYQTFGFDRYINQSFYRSREWKQLRQNVILRDNGCDLGVPGFEIHTKLLVHHMNPMIPENILNGDDWVLNPEYLITTTHKTHNAIHYGDDSLLPKPFVDRRPGDTKLW